MAKISSVSEFDSILGGSGGLPDEDEEDEEDEDDEDDEVNVLKMEEFNLRVVGPVIKRSESAALISSILLNLDLFVVGTLKGARARGATIVCTGSSVVSLSSSLLDSSYSRLSKPKGSCIG